MESQYYVDKWEKVNLSANRPNISAVTEIVGKIYAMSGRKAPKVRLFASPPKLTSAIRELGDGSARIYFSGSYDAYALARCDAGINEEGTGKGREEKVTLYECLAALSEHITDTYFGDEVFMASEKPLAIYLDANNDLHNDDGPAIVYSDGVGSYNWHGTQVKKRIILDPASITVSEIQAEDNAEMRRILIERYGMDRYIHDSGAQPIDNAVDATGRPVELFKLPNAILPIVRVVNSSPEADGSYRVYVLTATRNTDSALDAVASLAGTTTEHYTPIMEG